MPKGEQQLYEVWGRLPEESEIYLFLWARDVWSGLDRAERDARAFDDFEVEEFWATDPNDDVIYWPHRPDVATSYVTEEMLSSRFPLHSVEEVRGVGGCLRGWRMDRAR